MSLSQCSLDCAQALDCSSHLVFIMEKIISLLAITLADIFIHGKPLCHGFTIKLTPPLTKESIIPKTFDELFAKPDEMPQEFKRKFVAKDIAQSGSTKILVPSKDVQVIHRAETRNFINVPVIPQPFSDYKIIVATAPWNVRIDGDEAKPAVIYVVFPEDDGDATSLNIPAIYFIRNPEGPINLDELFNKKDRIDPLIIVDSNRTVTGINSSNITRRINFKSKLSKESEKGFSKPINVGP